MNVDAWGTLNWSAQKVHHFLTVCSMYCKLNHRFLTLLYSSFYAFTHLYTLFHHCYFPSFGSIQILIWQNIRGYFIPVDFLTILVYFPLRILNVIWNLNCHLFFHAFSTVDFEDSWTFTRIYIFPCPVHFHTISFLDSISIVYIQK